MAITEISVSKIYVLATEPTNKVKDRFWFDTTNNLLKRYDGTSWKPISVSSDDVVVLSSGNKISLTNYLNTQIAALAEGIDSKQDKLKYYSEGNSYPSAVIGDTSAAINFNAPDLSMFAIGKITINSDTGLIIDTTVSGSAISTSLPSSIDAASDNKLLSEKAVTTALSTKQDKLNYYSEVSGDTPSATISVKTIKLNGKVAEGNNTTASGSYSHAEGTGTTASGWYSHAEGGNTTASSNYSHAEGYNTTAKGINSHAEGSYAIASGNNSHAEGLDTKASSGSQHAQGKFNIEDANNKYADIIGNGSSSSERSNAATVSWEGISWSKTDVRAGGTDQDAAIHSLANKQDKLTHYTETTNTVSIGSLNKTNSLSCITENDIILASNNITIQPKVDSAGQTTTIKLHAYADSSYIKSAVDIAANNLHLYYSGGDGYGDITISEGGIRLEGDTLTFKDKLSITSGETAVSVNSSNLNLNNGKLLIDGVDVLSLKQNSTDTSLNTTDKTIVGAINELLASINANVITSTEQKRITTTSTASGIQMSTTAKACMVSINPVKTNVGAIYISTSSDTAPTINPLYPDQMPKYKFPDASQVYIWSDVNGDSVDLTIEYYG